MTQRLSSPLECGGRREGGEETRSRRDDNSPPYNPHEALCPPTQTHQIAKGRPPKQVNTLFLGLRGLRLSKCFPEQSDISTHQIRPGVGLSDAISAGGDHEIKLVKRNQCWGGLEILGSSRI